jgi:HEAT repeat protein
MVLSSLDFKERILTTSLKLLKDPNNEIIKCAMQALCRNEKDYKGNQNIIDVMVAFLGNSDKTLVVKAMLTLGIIAQSGDPVIIKKLHNILTNNEDEFVKGYAAEALGNLVVDKGNLEITKDILSLIEPLTKSSNAFTRERAADALFKLDENNSEKWHQLELEAKVCLFKEEGVLSLLLNLSNEVKKGDVVVVGAMSPFLKNKNANIKILAIGVLDTVISRENVLEKEECVDLICPLLDDPDEEVRTAAGALLEKIS